MSSMAIAIRQWPIANPASVPIKGRQIQVSGITAKTGINHKGVTGFAKIAAFTNIFVLPDSAHAPWLDFSRSREG